MFVFMSVPDLESLRWHSRVLLLFAADGDDQKLQQQGLIADGHSAGFAERDIKVFKVIGQSAEVVKLRHMVHATGSGFQVLLIGKDGSVKLRKTEPLTAEELFAIVDAMPMRQEEMKRHK